MSTSAALAETQSLLCAACCPACDGPGLELRLVCERGDQCLHRAVCESCNLSFEIRTGRAPDGLEPLLLNLACPDCDAIGAEFAMVCELPTRACDVIVACRSCGHPFRTDATEHRRR